MEFIEEMRAKARSFLMSRKLSYQQTFNPESLSAQRVLKDLARFCRANDSTFHEDPRLHAVLEGRREVFLRIIKHIEMDSQQFIKFYGKDLNE